MRSRIPIAVFTLGLLLSGLVFGSAGVAGAEPKFLEKDQTATDSSLLGGLDPSFYTTDVQYGVKDFAQIGNTSAQQPLATLSLSADKWALTAKAHIENDDSGSTGTVKCQLQSGGAVLDEINTTLESSVEEPGHDNKDDEIISLLGVAEGPSSVRLTCNSGNAGSISVLRVLDMRIMAVRVNSFSTVRMA